MISECGLRNEVMKFEIRIWNQAKALYCPAGYLFLALLVFLTPAIGWAHDVGITKTRLIQKSEKSYVLEADVTQPLVWAIKAPIFPKRFQVSPLEYVKQSGFMIVQATVTTRGAPLSPEDEILLPWMRNGAAVTAQWFDGSVHQGLFLRSLEGIQVPIRLLMPVVQPLDEICTEHFAAGLRHLTFHWLHLLFVGVLALLAPFRQLFKGLLYYLFGQAFSLVAADVGLSGLDLLFADILGIILVFLLARAVVKELPISRYFPLIFLFGLLHGLSYAQALASLELAGNQKIAALFMFDLAIDTGQFAVAGLSWLMAGFFGRMKKWRKAAAYTAGALSVAMLMALFQGHVMAGKTDVLNFNNSRITTRFTLPVSQKTQTGGQKPRGARRMTTPVMAYLSVAPYEVRLEILIRTRAAVQFLGVKDKGMDSISEASLNPVKNGILKLVKEANPVSIDGQPAEPVLTRADFVTLGPAGVIVGNKPVKKIPDQGIIGLTLVYETPNLADEVVLDWRLFSRTVKTVEAATTDPFGSAAMILSPNKNMLRWKSRLSGYRVPVIGEIAVEREKLPIPSLLLFLAALGFFLSSLRKKKSLLKRPILLSVAGLAFVLYPFVRFPADIPMVSRRPPPMERTSIILDGLLTNVYRAFDVRDENRVYDRLAMSVMGDQLTRIYLENRKSLEFENRGGARANVDDLKILSVKGVERGEEGAFIADTVWIVSGSVSHFGHTHYRRNKNRARVTFAADGKAWKIKDIELIEEERLL